jgi:hypothetical protein
MTRTLAPLLVLTLSCGSAAGTTPRIEAPASVGFFERFSGAVMDPGWSAAVPNVVDARVHVEGGSICLTMPLGSEGDIALRRKFDVAGVRGRRVRLTARVRTDAPAQSSAHVSMTVLTDDISPQYGGSVSSRKVNSGSWRSIHTVIDVPASAASGELFLTLHGSGRAWFDDVEVTTVDTPPTSIPNRLSAQQVTDLVTFTRAAALIRYLHPSDEAATLDWNSFFPAAIARLLQRDPQRPLRFYLQELFSAISPTVTFSDSRVALNAPVPPRQSGAHLVRWRRYGLGTSPPYATYREGRDSDTTYAVSTIPLQVENLQHCRAVSVRAFGRQFGGSGTVSLIAALRLPGVETKEVSKVWREADNEVLVTAELPRDVQSLQLSLRLDGQGDVVVNKLTWSCDSTTQRVLDIGRDVWSLSGLTDLYAWEIVRCDSAACVRLRRKPFDTDFVTERDVLSADLGGGTAIYLPLAVWADAAGTLPDVEGDSPEEDFTIDDLPMRLSVISSAWGTLSLFYPYFKDQGTDWLAMLPEALRSAAAARSARETHASLAHLVARLRDNHARVTHAAAPSTGVLPITFRRFDTKIIVTGGLPQFTKDIPPGSELLELDGIGAIQAYDQAAIGVSAATEGLKTYLTPIRMGMGAPGTFRRLRIQRRGEVSTSQILPLVPRDLYLHANRESRPRQMRELAPDIYYVDFDQLQGKAWVEFLPVLERARVLLLDFRGFVNSTAAEALSRFASHDLQSPTWQIPRVHNVRKLEYNESHWDIRPRAPKLNAKLVVLTDGRSMSSAETILQIIQENRLGVFVGEASGGTNGNMNSFQTPAGFEVRFTGMRVIGKDGSTIQGRGIVPDHIVTPTLEGVRADRDEILEAGIAVAQRLLSP